MSVENQNRREEGFAIPRALTAGDINSLFSDEKMRAIKDALLARDDLKKENGGDIENEDEKKSRVESILNEINEAKESLIAELKNYETEVGELLEKQKKALSELDKAKYRQADRELVKKIEDLESKLDGFVDDDSIKNQIDRFNIGLERHLDAINRLPVLDESEQGRERSENGNEGDERLSEGSKEKKKGLSSVFRKRLSIMFSRFSTYYSGKQLSKSQRDFINSAHRDGENGEFAEYSEGLGGYLEWAGEKSIRGIFSAVEFVGATGYKVTKLAIVEQISELVRYRVQKGYFTKERLRMVRLGNELDEEIGSISRKTNFDRVIEIANEGEALSESEFSERKKHKDELEKDLKALEGDSVIEALKKQEGLSDEEIAKLKADLREEYDQINEEIELQEKIREKQKEVEESLARKEEARNAMLLKLEETLQNIEDSEFLDEGSKAAMKEKLKNYFEKKIASAEGSDELMDEYRELVNERLVTDISGKQAILKAVQIPIVYSFIGGAAVVSSGGLAVAGGAYALYLGTEMLIGFAKNKKNWSKEAPGEEGLLKDKKVESYLSKFRGLGTGTAILVATSVVSMSIRSVVDVGTPMGEIAGFVAEQIPDSVKETVASYIKSTAAIIRADSLLGYFGIKEDADLRQSEYPEGMAGDAEAAAEAERVAAEKAEMVNNGRILENQSQALGNYIDQYKNLAEEGVAISEDIQGNISDLSERRITLVDELNNTDRGMVNESLSKIPQELEKLSGMQSDLLADKQVLENSITPDLDSDEIDRIEAEIERIDLELEKVEGEMDKMKSMEIELNKQIDHLDKIENEIELIDQEIESAERRLQYFKTVDETIENLIAEKAKIDAQLGKVSGDIDSLSSDSAASVASAAEASGASSVSSGAEALSDLQRFNINQDAIDIGLVRPGDGISQTLARSIDQMDQDQLDTLAKQYGMKSFSVEERDGLLKFRDNIDNERNGEYKRWVANLTKKITDELGAGAVEGGGMTEEGWSEAAPKKISALMVEENGEWVPKFVDTTGEVGKPDQLLDWKDLDETKFNAEGNWTKDYLESKRLEAETAEANKDTEGTKDLGGGSVESGEDIDELLARVDETLAGLEGGGGDDGYEWMNNAETIENEMQAKKFMEVEDANGNLRKVRFIFDGDGNAKRVGIGNLVRYMGGDDLELARELAKEDNGMNLLGAKRAIAANRTLLEMQDHYGKEVVNTEAYQKLVDQYKGELKTLWGVGSNANVEEVAKNAGGSNFDLNASLEEAQRELAGLEATGMNSVGEIDFDSASKELNDLMKNSEAGGIELEDMDETGNALRAELEKIPSGSIDRYASLLQDRLDRGIDISESLEDLNNYANGDSSFGKWWKVMTRDEAAELVSRFEDVNEAPEKPELDKETLQREAEKLVASLSSGGGEGIGIENAGVLGAMNDAEIKEGLSSNVIDSLVNSGDVTQAQIDELDELGRQASEKMAGDGVGTGSGELRGIDLPKNGEWESENGVKVQFDDGKIVSIDEDELAEVGGLVWDELAGATKIFLGLNGVESFDGLDEDQKKLIGMYDLVREMNPDLSTKNIFNFAETPLGEYISRDLPAGSGINESPQYKAIMAAALSQN